MDDIDWSCLDNLTFRNYINEAKKFLIEEGRWDKDDEDDEIEESCRVRRPRSVRRNRKMLESRRINRRLR